MTRFSQAAAFVLLFASFAAGLGGCASGNPSEGSFTKRVDKIRPGMTQGEVREALGAPDRKSIGFVEVRPPPGPEAALVGTLPAGTRYEDWFYKQGDTHYHVLFGPGTTHPGRWEVITVRASPASTAVGGRDVVPPP